MRTKYKQLDPLSTPLPFQHRDCDRIYNHDNITSLNYSGFLRVQIENDRDKVCKYIMIRYADLDFTSDNVRSNKAQQKRKKNYDVIVTE